MSESGKASVFTLKSTLKSIGMLILYLVSLSGGLFIGASVLSQLLLKNGVLGERHLTLFVIIVYTIVLSGIVMFAYKISSRLVTSETKFKTYDISGVSKDVRNSMRHLITISIVISILVLAYVFIFDKSEIPISDFLESPGLFKYFIVSSLIFFPIIDTLILKRYMYEKYFKEPLFFFGFYQQIISYQMEYASKVAGVEIDASEISTERFQNASFAFFYGLLFTIIYKSAFHLFIGGFIGMNMYLILFPIGIFLGLLYSYTRDIKLSILVHFIVYLAIYGIVIIIA